MGAGDRMKFAVEIWSNGKARTGLLHPGGGIRCIETPALLLATRKGLPNFISPDLLSSLPSPHAHLLQVCPLHFLEGLSMNMISKMGGLHQMLGMKDYCFAAVLRDSIQCPPEASAANKMGASFESPCGRLLIKPETYVEMISSMKPNLWASLADEVPASVSAKRNRISVDRTLKWLDQCISLNPSCGEQLGSIVGGSSIEERQRCAREVAKRDLSGYWISGFGFGESMDSRPSLLNAVTGDLPEEKLRVITGLDLPEEVLQGVAAGVDLFDSTYIYHLTIGGFALTFPLQVMDRKAADFWSSEEGGDCTKINLKATVYRKDTRPIIEGCRCYTCHNHSRAYIHHLLNVNEMLSQILLEMHNTHHYLGFFECIRKAIKAGEFEEYWQSFVQSRGDHPVQGKNGGCELDEWFDPEFTQHSIHVINELKQSNNRLELRIRS